MKRANLLRLFIALWLLAVITSCQQVIEDEIVNGEYIPPDAQNILNPNADKVPFYGIQFYDNITDTTVRINWKIPEVEEGLTGVTHFRIYETTSGLPVYKTEVLGNYSHATIANLTPQTNYTFRVIAYTSDNSVHTYINDRAVITQENPDPPTIVEMFIPAEDTGSERRPTIKVGGVKAGDTITLYKDATCSDEVGEAVAYGETVNIQSAKLVNGVYKFYAMAKSPYDKKSTCSGVYAEYILNMCPNNWIVVPDDPYLGTPEFCVMKYEAKLINEKATSVDVVTPWTNLSQVEAHAACIELGEDFGLISNIEWMAIARNIETQDANWHRGKAVSSTIEQVVNETVVLTEVKNCLFQGNTGLNTDCSYAGNIPDFGSTRNPLAKHVLSNGEEIWDFSGNVWEWVDWELGGGLNVIAPPDKMYVITDNGPVNEWRDFFTITENVNIMAPILWMPVNGGLLNYDHRIGAYKGGFDSHGGAMLRGGSVSSGINAGVYSMDLTNTYDTKSNYFGFRCVKRP